jgi:hypothetical protein
MPRKSNNLNHHHNQDHEHANDVLANCEEDALNFPKPITLDPNAVKNYCQDMEMV